MIKLQMTMMRAASAAKQERSHTSLGVQIVNLWNFTNKICLIILILWIFLKLITQPFCSSISY